MRAFNTLMMCLRGSVCLYQGEELGLPEADVPYEDLQDPYGVQFWPEFKGRDGCRTPMVWEALSENAGFGSGRPWLPVSSAQAALAVDQQEADPATMLHHYRRSIALRHAHAALILGDQSPLSAEGSLLTFTRTQGNEEIFCAFNLGWGKVTATLPEGSWDNLATELEGAVDQADGKAVLPGWGYAIFARKAA